MRIVLGSLIFACAAALWLILMPGLLPGIVLLMFLFTALVAALFTLRAHRKRMRVLHEKVSSFLHDGVEPPYSLAEDDYAEIENDIAEMAHRMLVQRETVARENRNAVDFISDVSHQLKTPLTALKLYCEMGKSEKQLLLIEHMEVLIYSLLRLRKLDAGAYEMNFASHDMSDTVREIIQELSVLYPHKKFPVSISPVVFRFDEYWMGEALMNVIKNACEHTAESGTVRVALERTDKAVIIAVQDDGGGVPMEELPRLFQRFYRSSTQRRGSGLGLAITRSIVSRHHGTISAQNAEKGLRITICLPELTGKLPIP